MSFKETNQCNPQIFDGQLENAIGYALHAARVRIVKNCYQCGAQYSLYEDGSCEFDKRATLTLHSTTQVHTVHCCSIECVRIVVAETKA